ncbi:MAG: transcription antitermination factor NusB [Betaproteobacteria bacterium]|nr:transcription antitermination factor NusB [Betaproteobacteria bacterium]
MKSPRRRSREFALQALYQWQMTGQELADLHKQYAEVEGFDKANAPLFLTLLKGVVEASQDLADKLAPHLDRTWAEVSPIERSILWIGAFELVSQVETPYRVVLNEAIELAKSFGGTDGHRYVNGVLDKLAAVVRADEITYQAENEVPHKPRNPAKVVVRPRRVPKEQAPE